ncbi:ABC transporter substrate-binding protein [Kitasatospora sp. NPDC088346]|uniref:ABC transporter substrate-binding protein n=1 Tax=Kitasatospora sp. NPDC088346 TaxID=3364073 RepID=UPI00381474C0
MGTQPAEDSRRDRHPWDRRRFGQLLVGGAVLAAGGVLGRRALAGDAATPGDPDGTGPVTLATGKDTAGYLRGVLDGWNAAHPAEPAELVELPAAADEVHAQLGGGNGRFDVLNLDVVWTAEFAARGWITPLEEAQFPLGGFLPPVLSSARFAGRLYAVPYVTNAAMLYYRSDILDAAGERPPSTWAELARLSGAVAPANGMAGYAGQLSPYEGLTVNVLEAVRSAGGDVLDADGTPVVDSRQAQAGLEFLAGGLRGGWIPQEALRYQEEESREAFQSGRLLFLRNWPYVYPQAASGGSAVAGRFGVVPLPGPHGPGSGVLGGSALAVSRFSRRQRTARALIAYLSGRDVQRQVLVRGGLPPVWADLYEDPELLERFPYLPVLRDAVLAAGSRPGIPQYQQLSLALSATSYEVLLGRRTAADGLAALAGDLRDIVR